MESESLNSYQFLTLVICPCKSENTVQSDIRVAIHFYHIDSLENET